MKKLIIIFILMSIACIAIGQNSTLGGALDSPVYELPEFPKLRKQVIAANTISYIYEDGSLMYITDNFGYIREMTIVFSDPYKVKVVNKVLLDTFESPKFIAKKIISTLPLKYEISLKEGNKRCYMTVTKSYYKVGNTREQIVVITTKRTPYVE